MAPGSSGLLALLRSTRLRDRWLSFRIDQINQAAADRRTVYISASVRQARAVPHRRGVSFALSGLPHSSALASSHISASHFYPVPGFTPGFQPIVQAAWLHRSFPLRPISFIPLNTGLPGIRPVLHLLRWTTGHSSRWATARVPFAIRTTFRPAAPIGLLQAICLRHCPAARWQAQARRNSVRGQQFAPSDNYAFINSIRNYNLFMSTIRRR